MKFVVIDIGCLECRELSTILGIYDSRADAQAAHPEAKFIRSGADVRFAADQVQILTFPPSTVPDYD